MSADVEPATVRRMTSATSTPLPMSDPNVRGLRPGRSVLMGLLRLAVLIGTQTLYTYSLSGDEDPVGAGLTGMLLLVTLSGTWAIIDGRRRPLRTGVLAWLLASALAVLLGSLPATLSYPADEGGWTGLSDYLGTVADGAGFMFGLVAVPALGGLGLGHLIRVSLRRPAS